MYLRLALIIVTVLIILFGMIAVYEPGVQVEAGEQPLTALQPADVNTINLLRPGEEKLHFHREADGWYLRFHHPQLDEQRSLPASPFAMEQLLALCTTPSYTRFPLGDQDASKFGVAPAKAVVYLNGLELLFGDTDPIEHHRYVRIGDTMHLSDDRSYRQVLAQPEELVSKYLLPGTPALSAIAMDDMSLAKDANQHWQLAGSDASADALQSLVDEWRHAHAIDISFVGSAPDGQRVAITLADGNKVELIMVHNDDDLLVYRPEWKLRYRFLPTAHVRLTDPKQHETAAD